VKTSEKIRNIYAAEKDIPAEYRLEPLIQKEYLIGGKLKNFRGALRKVHSGILMKKGSALEKKFIGEYPLMTAKEALEALAAAEKAYDNGKGEWPAMGVEERIRCLEKFTGIMRTKRDEIVKLLMWEIGKSLEDSQKEFDRTVEYIADTAAALKDLDRTSSRFTETGGIIAQIKRAPLGVVLCMGPYNYPLNETFTTLIPALLMGNCVIFKPAKFGALLHRPLLEAFRDSFPPGAVNTIYGEGREIITPLMESGRINVLAFIGSSAVADTLKRLHPKPHRLRCVLGLDAKNPGIILDDADLKTAVKECVTGVFSYNGQRCTALKILFVHKNFQNTFIEAFVREIEALKYGMPWEKDVKLTPLPDRSRIDYFNQLIEDAKKYGGRVINEEGGVSEGNFFYPAVVYPVKKEMRLWREEQFGPVMPFTYFEDIKEPLDYVINSNFGQQVSIFGRDPERISRLTDILVNQVSRVNINSQCQRGPDILPFTGRKDSAEGTLSVSDALRAFSIRTLVAFKDSGANKDLVRDILRNRRSKFLSTDFIL